MSGRREREIAAGLALAVAAVGLTACEDARAKPPISAPYPDARPSRVVEHGPVPLVEYETPAESLYVRDETPEGPARLLFFQGRGVPYDGEGNGYLPDGDGSRVLVIGDQLRVIRTVGGPSDEAGRVGMPLSVAPTSDGAVFVVDVENPKGLLYFAPSGDFVGAASPPVVNGSLRAGPDGVLWAARSPYILGFEPTGPTAPLLWRFDPLAGEGSEVARIEPVGDARWNRLANAGAVAVGSDGTAFFTFLLRNELRAYGPDGELRWRVRRALPFDVPDLVLRVVDEEPQIPLRPVTQALAVGPDGLLYALTATEEPRPADGGPGASRRRLEVYDPATGALLRASMIPDRWVTLAADREGRVHHVEAEAILGTAPPVERRALPTVRFESFAGETASFSDYRGKALLVNFWASWCVPCREELPRLAEYYRTLDHARVEFLAISEDEDVEAARSFAEGFDLPFPLFLGRGELHEQFHYIGLPYTLIVDYRGRVVEEIYGFGSEETWNRLTSLLEGEMARTAPGGGG